MHSSGMHTTRLLTESQHALPNGGMCLGWVSDTPLRQTDTLHLRMVKIRKFKTGSHGKIFVNATAKTTGCVDVNETVHTLRL